MSEVDRLSLQLAAAHLQLAAGRQIIEALLDENSDPPDVAFARTAAQEWLDCNTLRHEETLSALGALLRGDLA